MVTVGFLAADVTRDTAVKSTLIILKVFILNDGKNQLFPFFPPMYFKAVFTC